MLYVSNRSLWYGIIFNSLPSSVQLLTTQIEVSKLQEDLETMQPLLAQAAIETEETMEKIKVDTVMTKMIIYF